MRAPVVCSAFETGILITLVLADDEDDDDNDDDFVRIRNGLMWLGVGVMTGDILLFEPSRSR
jgi:hypothetical protein